MINNKTKFCTKCNQEKLKTEFYSDKSRKDKLANICKNCDLLKSKKYNKTDRGKESQKNRKKKWLKNNQEKRKAHRTVCNAIKTGALIKSKFCEVCRKINCKLSGHHDDYSEPLEVIWVCDACHPSLDKQRRLKELNNNTYII